jgi:hypothetical protein
MPTIQVEAQVSRRELLKAVEQLDALELQQFVADVLALRAQREAPRLSPAETELLLRINQGLPEELRPRFEHLIAKRRNETLTPEEYDELLRLTETLEQQQASRIAALTELAQLRKTPLAALMKDLEIQA